MIIPNIISNPNRPDRVERLINELTTQNITEYKMWPAIFIHNKPPRTGINLAHKQIVKDALIEGLPEVCIWEDDIKFYSPDGWDYFLRNKPIVPYDIYLGGIYRGQIEENGRVERYTGAHCYIVHERFYDIFLNVPEDLDIDGAMSGLGEFYCCYPFACVQWDGWSDNCKNTMDYSYLLNGRKIYGLNA